jgi:hypothetical protein
LPISLRGMYSALVYMQEAAVPPRLVWHSTLVRGNFGLP